MVMAILLLGVLLKVHNYTVYPQRGATSDEYTYSFLGLSLLTKGIPISWSHFGVYKNRQDVTIDTIQFPIVWPYFDHPPLFGIFVGGWSLLHGEDSFEKIKLSTIRLVPIVLSVVSSVLVFLLTYRLTDYMTAVWALLIYSTVTIFVIQSRVVLAENFLTPIFLAAMYFFHRVVKKMSIRRALLLGLFGAVAFWTKESGITLALALFFLLLQNKVKRPFVMTFLTTATLGIMGYALYGWIYDWETFVKIFALQGGRDVGPQTLWYLLSTPVIVNKVYYDGWYYFGFFALAVLFSQIKRYTLILIPSLIYFLFLLLSLTQRGERGWYMIPLYPWMAIASAVILRDAGEQQFGRYIVFLLLVGFVFFEFMFQALFGLTSAQFRTLFLLLFGPAVLAFSVNKDRFARPLYNFYFYLAIIVSTYATVAYVHPS